MRNFKSIIILTLLVSIGCNPSIKTENVIVPTALQSFDLNQVKLLPGAFQEAQDTDLDYIMEMNPDRLLAPYLVEAGLEPKASKYGNWENTGLDGHIGGHYLSALANMYASTGRQDVKDRLDYMIAELKRSQEASGNGYLGGIPNSSEMWAEIKAGNIRSGGFSLNDRWVPLYNIHKIYAGLRDAYQIAGIEEAKMMLIDLTDWMVHVTKDLTEEQIQQMLISEHGGLNEVFADVYEITNDPKHLALARNFSHKTILEPLLQDNDVLTGMHANTQIPKVIGFQKVAEVANDEEWAEATDFFWRTVVNDRSISIGGNSVREHFNPKDDFSSMINTNQGPETCNTYNMIRLSRMLFLRDPQPEYINFYERAVYNHILSSQHPDGGFVYFTPIRPKHYRVYSQPHQGFWCCVGSGIENHGKYGEMIYAYQGEDVFVNLFMSSTLDWEAKGLKLELKSGLPDAAEAQITVRMDQPKKFKINIRRPDWLKSDQAIWKVNGSNIKLEGDGTYLAIDKEWKDGDQISLTLPMETKVEQLPDDSPWVSFVKGPFVMAAVTDTTELEGLYADASRMAHIASGPMYPIDEAPVIVADNLDALAEQLEPVQNEFAFTINQIYPEKYQGIKLVPFYQVHEARYMLYWPLMSQAELKGKLDALRKEEAKKLALEARTIDQVATGEQQPESDHGFKGSRTSAGIHEGRFWRHAADWFSYEMKNPDQKAEVLRITYFGGDSGRSFDILINDQLIETVNLERKEDGGFYDVDYDLPKKVSENTALTLKFQAKPRSMAGGIYYVRLLGPGE